MRAERLGEQDLVPGEASLRGRSGAARPAGNRQRDERVTGLEPAEGSLGEGRRCGRLAGRGALRLALRPGGSGPAESRSRQSSAHTQPRSAALHWEGMLDDIPPSLLLGPDGETEIPRGRVVPRFSKWAV